VKLGMARKVQLERIKKDVEVYKGNKYEVVFGTKR
jgi:hypothetical protein